MPSKIADNFQVLLDSIKNDFPTINFVEAEAFRWSDEHRTIYYDKSADYSEWSLLHELGHMTCHHQGYSTDTRLVRMEVEAWQCAKELSSRYGLKIDEEYTQDCIDSYRNWQYKRSSCPNCQQTGVETQSGSYSCFNCRHKWQVTTSRFCRVYRQSADKLKTPD